MQLHTRILAVVGSAAAVVALGATAASASVAKPSLPPGPMTTTAITHLTHRPDSGGNGNWANDDFWRTATIKNLGPAALSNCAVGATVCYEFTADLSDVGSFTTIPGAYTPNQGLDPNSLLPNHPYTGTMNGTGGFTDFYADGLPNAALVPHSVSGSTDPSSAWPNLFFPSTVTVTGVNEATFNYNYDLTALTFKSVQVTEHKLIFVYRHHHWVPEFITYKVWVKVPVLKHYHWDDANFDNSGQSATAGNIFGS